MQSPAESELSALSDAIKREGFHFVTAPAMRPMLASAGDLSDWSAFAESWSRLGPDPYLAAKGRFRRRRHGTFTSLANGVIAMESHQAHYQSLQYNTLQGDIQRWFEPIEPAIAASVSLKTILTFCHRLFHSMAAGISAWHVEVHQFRIEASAAHAGEPTPEGSHRDGVDFVLVLMIDRHNIASGTTTIHTPDGRPLGDFTLKGPFDAALIHDPRVFHGVTPVTPLDPSEPAHRDVLVVTFKAKA
jgi:hypothetical protein